MDYQRINCPSLRTSRWHQLHEPWHNYPVRNCQLWIFLSWLVLLEKFLHVQPVSPKALIAIDRRSNNNFPFDIDFAFANDQKRRSRNEQISMFQRHRYRARGLRRISGFWRFDNRAEFQLCARRCLETIRHKRQSDEWPTFRAASIFIVWYRLVGAIAVYASVMKSALRCRLIGT